MKDPAFDEDAVRALATAESFARGRDYLRRGAVSGPERRDNRLTAEVEGSEFAPYAVTIELHDGGVAGSRCSCLYDWGGVCKHVVAVLVKYLEAPSAVAQRPSLDDMLHGLDREALAALLIKRAGQDPALASGSRRNWPPARRKEVRRVGAEPPSTGADLAAGRALLSGRTSRGRGWNDDRSVVDEEAFVALIGKETFPRSRRRTRCTEYPRAGDGGARAGVARAGRLGRNAA